MITQSRILKTLLETDISPKTFLLDSVNNVYTYNYLFYMVIIIKPEQSGNRGDHKIQAHYGYRHYPKADLQSTFTIRNNEILYL